MDVMEKLVELLVEFVEVDSWDNGEFIEKHIEFKEIASNLIANGVTVQENCKDCSESTKNCIVKLQEQIADLRSAQEWISVKDRLPEEECHCLVIDAAGDIEIDCYDGKGRFVLCRSGAVQHPSHWMPLPKMPQPPKGE